VRSHALDVTLLASMRWITRGERADVLVAGAALMPPIL
jgi:hypothetical protein